MRTGAIPLALVLAAYVLALVQRVGLDASDTKIDLHVDPGTFLGQVASVWSPTAGLGHVQGGQYSGYLWPMGPFFSLGHLIGASGWLTERLWLGTLLALAAWGAVRLLDELLDRRRGVAHVVAGMAYMVNPYVVVFTNRTTVFLLAYAALPWLLIIVHRGVRHPRSWWWPAAFALVTTSTAGGVNATVTVMILLGPLLLACYEGLVGGVARRHIVSFGCRAGVATAAASIWWVVPLLVQSRYGLNFLQFTEQVGSIWATTSLSESLRLMGYWPSYLGVGYSDHLTPYFGDSGTLLFDPAVVIASLLVPAIAVAGYVRTRRWRYAPFLLLCALVTLVVMSVGYPDGTPGRRAARFLFDHVTAIDFLRTTYKAGPLLALAVALLAGAFVRAAWGRSPLTGRVALAAAATTLIVLGALPFFAGRAVELHWNRIPAAWTQAAHDLDQGLPANFRAVVLPGQAFAFYTWGGTVDPILPSLTDRPVAIRNTPPYDDLHAVDYLWTVDDLLQQQRLVPGELPPLLSLMSARAVITATDDDTGRSGAMAPAAAARQLAAQPGFATPARSYGPLRSFAAPAGTAQPPQRLPEIRRYDLAARGLVRIESTAQPVLLDGSARGIADAAALGLMPQGRALEYAGDLGAATLRARAQAGADVIITDSNRRQAYVASRTRQNVGWITPATEAPPTDSASIDPFPGAGSAGQTVATFTGARYVTAPYNPDIAEFPEHGPYAVFDGNPRTSWLADPTLDDSRRWVEVGLDRPREIPYVDVLPDASNPLVSVSRVDVDGRRFAVHPGWNRLPVALQQAAVVRVTIVGLRHRTGDSGSVGGLDEVRIPGVRIRELLRPPVLAEDALRGAGLLHTSLTYVFERTTADQPLLRGPAPARLLMHGDRLQSESALVRQAQDAEAGIARAIVVPAARRFRLSGLATASPRAPDPALDALARTRTGGATFTSSGRLEGLPGARASSAFDGRTGTAWTAPVAAGQPAWIAWRTPHPAMLRRLRLTRSASQAGFPALVAVSLDGGPSRAIPVSPSGLITLPRSARASAVRMTVLRASGPSSSVAIAEIAGPGVPHASPAPPAAAIGGRCGGLHVVIGGHTIALRVAGIVAALDAGRPLRLTACARETPLPAGPAQVLIAPAIVRPLLVALRSPAPQPLASGATMPAGAVLDSGHQGRGSYTGIRLAVHHPSWLVLGESYNRGWRATCDGRSLGAPAVVDGFANGWRVRAGCQAVTITFAPQGAVMAGFAAGAAACLLLLGVLLWRRPRSSGVPDEPAAALEDPPSARWAPARALTAGVVCAITFGIAFGLRTGVIIGPAFALILWRGIPSRRLLLAAGALLVVAVPVIYLAFPGQNEGGYDSRFTTQHLGAHWVTLGAFALLALVLARDLSTATRRAGRDRAPAPPPADA